MTQLSPVEIRELRRMTLWFKDRLPPHAIEEWYITTMPASPPVVIEDTDSSCTHMASPRGTESRRVAGYGRCVRCGKQFPIMEMGNAVAGTESRVASVVEDMKARVRVDAKRDGPCWGDVPQLTRDPGCIQVASGADRP